MAKIRYGFISNSSSSSFILALDRKPETIEDMKELLFGTDEFYPDPYRDGGYPTLKVAETVFNDIKDQKPMSRDQVFEELGTGWLEGAPDYNSFKDKTKDYGIDWKAYQKACREFQDNSADDLILEFKGKELYLVEYYDDSAYGCALEHGTVFDKICTYRLSKH